MIRILDIAQNDLMQLMRDRKTFLFFLLMPILFTLLFGYAFGGFSDSSDSRLPVGFIDEDGSSVSGRLRDLLANSEVIRLEVYNASDMAGVEARVADEKLPAAIVIPEGYGRAMLHGKRGKLNYTGDVNSTAGTLIKSEILATVVRLESAVRTARVFEENAGDKEPFNYILDLALSKWEDPPISINETTSTVIPNQSSAVSSLSHFAPGMMLQFAIAGLLTSSQMIVAERKSRALQRLLTTSTMRVHILLGHYLSVFIILLMQFVVLLTFGQVILKVNYMRDPIATFLVAITTAICLAALGLLIGIMAKNEDQAVMFSLVPMFLMSGLGGAWVPLEETGLVFQTIGHFTPIAWSMDGFKDVTIRGWGLGSVLLPAAALIGYGVLFFALASWRFRTE